MPFALVPFLLLVVPIVEIATFIAIGGQIGIALTLLMILVTAVIGTILLRIQGLSLIQEIQSKVASGQVPGRALGDGAMIMVAGILLLTPGFVTDGIGFLLFVPAIRTLIWSFLASRIKVAQPGVDPFAQQQGGRSDPFDGDGQTIDLDEDEYSAGPADPESPWNPDNKR
ncbi:MAG: membrane protein FxsA [Rhizobiaceae bacterium]|nr:membrane protein FxsA [Rhizobiaceae bacterium]